MRSAAYVRRLLLSHRLYGFKVGPVWAIYEQDLETFQRLRRPPGRPAQAPAHSTEESAMRLRVDGERALAGTDGALRKPRRKKKGRQAEPA
ncbi:MAG: hypothetical protein DLM58_16720 [Pseudonocardiales bacterium]|nr:MAG: hypothetical protein DLM58_16720 [Pseudonocardiales bacterium]